MKLSPLFLIVLVAGCTDSAKPEPALPPVGLAGSQKLQAAAKYRGAVKEVIEKEQFSYVRVGDNWFALVGVKLKKGEMVSIEEQAVFNNFQSKTLNRTFKKIIFGILLEPKQKSDIKAIPLH
ncbi:MAG: hypothetical protein V4534_03145 [Myxococcota bacterium]